MILEFIYNPVFSWAYRRGDTYYSTFALRAVRLDPHWKKVYREYLMTGERPWYLFD